MLLLSFLGASIIDYMKNITLAWLKKKHACQEGIIWFAVQDERDVKKVIRKLMVEDHFNWANWTICRILNRMQCIQYAVYVANLVLPIYEAEYPDDKRPRQAIAAAKKYLKNPNRKNAAGAVDAADDAGVAYYAAFYAADDTYCAAYCAADAAYCAAYCVTDDAVDAAYCAADDAAGAAIKIRKKMINYGLRLLK